MVANEFTIADPRDAGMMDVVGFDSAAPALIADFAKTLDTETLAGIERVFRTPTLVGCCHGERSRRTCRWCTRMLSSQRMSQPRTSATRTTSNPTEVGDGYRKTMCLPRVYSAPR